MAELRCQIESSRLLLHNCSSDLESSDTRSHDYAWWLGALEVRLGGLANAAEAMLA